MNIYKFLFTKNNKNKKDNINYNTNKILRVYYSDLLVFCNNKTIKDATVYIKHTFVNYY